MTPAWRMAMLTGYFIDFLRHHADWASIPSVSVEVCFCCKCTFIQLSFQRAPSFWLCCSCSGY